MQTREERLRYCREHAAKKREEQNYYIDINCRLCGNWVQIKKYAENFYKRRGGGTCSKCLRKISSDTLKKLRASQTPEERTKFAKMARAKANCSIGVKKQWESFRSNSEKYKQICEAKSKRMETVWKHYPEETKNHIVSALAGSKNCGRSKLSDEFKQHLINNGLYHGFVSEQVFHGFIPDEINHDLKIVIEVYGDIYHCNPRKYKNTDLYISAIQRTVGEQWKRDEKKLASYYRNGYTVIVVWEYDIRKNLSETLEKVKTEIERKRYGLHATY